MAGSAVFLYALALISLITTSLARNGHQSGFSSRDLQPFHVNATHNARNMIVGAPYYRNVTAGDAWVIPSSAYDLGARGMTCECFDPDYKCCIATTAYVAPFCVPKNYSCCGDTFCDLGETCCGDSCCPKLTDCWFSPGGTGCCPHGKLCSGPSKCYDHNGGNCSGTFTPKQQCCPSNVPYCRSFPPFGQGCYAYTSTTSTTTTSLSFTEPRLDGRRSTEYQITNMSSTTVVEVVTVVPKPSGAVSFIFPPPPTEPPNEVVSTTYVLTFASRKNSTTATATSARLSSPTSRPTASASPSVSREFPTLSKTTSSSTSPLCFNPTLLSPSACPTRTTTLSASKTNNAGFPGASTVTSQANGLLPPFNLPISLHQMYSLGLGLFVLFLGLGMMNLACREHDQRPVLVRRDSDRLLVRRDIQLVEGSGRVLVGELGKEVKVVKESGRRFSNGLIIDGEKVWAIE